MLIKRQCWFLRLVTIGNHATDNIAQKVDRAAMTRMLNLRDVLELINNRLDDRTLAGEQLVHQRHQAFLHVLTRLDNQLNPHLLKKRFKELL